MDSGKFEYNLEQWKNLSQIEINKVVNHYWDPYNPSIGQKTKFEIVNCFIKETKIPAHQFGIKSFGWTVYMLFLIVENTNQSIPSTFLGLSVNKGVIVNNVADKKTMVKFEYGGTFEMDLTEKIRIS